MLRRLLIPSSYFRVWKNRPWPSGKEGENQSLSRCSHSSGARLHSGREVESGDPHVPSCRGRGKSICRDFCGATVLDQRKESGVAQVWSK